MDMKKPIEPPAPAKPSGDVLKKAHQARQPFRRERREPAWWTARATSGEVAPGFSKAEILRPKEEDPRAPGGILQRAEELLESLKG